MKNKNLISIISAGLGTFILTASIEKGCFSSHEIKRIPPHSQGGTIASSTAGYGGWNNSSSNSKNIDPCLEKETGQDESQDLTKEESPDLFILQNKKDQSAQLHGRNRDLERLQKEKEKKELDDVIMRLADDTMLPLIRDATALKEEAQRRYGECIGKASQARGPDEMKLLSIASEIWKVKSSVEDMLNFAHNRAKDRIKATAVSASNRVNSGIAAKKSAAVVAGEAEARSITEEENLTLRNDRWWLNFYINQFQAVREPGSEVGGARVAGVGEALGGSPSLRGGINLEGQQRLLPEAASHPLLRLGQPPNIGERFRAAIVSELSQRGRIEERPLHPRANPSPFPIGRIEERLLHARANPSPSPIVITDSKERIKTLVRGEMEETEQRIARGEIQPLEDKMCTICIDEENNSRTRPLKCRHYFCVECITEYLDFAQRDPVQRFGLGAACPKCKTNISHLCRG